MRKFSELLLLALLCLPLSCKLQQVDSKISSRSNSCGVKIKLEGEDKIHGTLGTKIGEGAFGRIYDLNPSDAAALPADVSAQDLRYTFGAAEIVKVPRYLDEKSVKDFNLIPESQPLFVLIECVKVIRDSIKGEEMGWRLFLFVLDR